MDFYIFWKSHLWRTPPSLRQLFYPLVNLPFLTLNLPLPLSSIPIPLLSPHPFTLYSPSSHSPYPTSHPLYSSPLLIHNLSTTHTSYPQLFHRLSTTPILLIDLSSTPLFPLILLIIQSSPL